MGKLGEGSVGILCIVLADFLKPEMCEEGGQRRAPCSGTALPSAYKAPQDRIGPRGPPHSEPAPPFHGGGGDLPCSHSLRPGRGGAAYELEPDSSLLELIALFAATRSQTPPHGVWGGAEKTASSLFAEHRGGQGSEGRAKLSCLQFKIWSNSTT